ncbi:MAG: Gfo/Idh/MocA family oxidoreductase [Alphaproteobacteria bacterium]|nr:Gfo/Idh/MocA family oxidoreductase [Alphaproteobacteria bacterium]
MAAQKKIRYGVVGLGYISQKAMLPAFRNARRNSVLAALISGDARKRRALGKSYDVPILAGYDEFDALLASGRIDAIYIGLPNTLHRDFAVRALAAGVHVMCDKPLATSVEDCLAMEQAARSGRTRLMTAYRLHFEPATLAAYDLIHGGKLGEVRFATSQFCVQVRAGNIRTQAELAGGPLFDLGVYCVNAMRHIFRAEPVEVFAAAASGKDPRFREVEEIAQVTLRFPGARMAAFTCAMGAARSATIEVFGTKGTLRLDQAYGMLGGKAMRVDWPLPKPRRLERAFPALDQFAPLLLHFSDCIAAGREPVPSGADGRADIRVVEALRQAMHANAPVKLDPIDFQGPKLTARNAMRRPAHGRIDLVGARSSSL